MTDPDKNTDKDSSRPAGTDRNGEPSATRTRWEKEQQTVKAVQIAFDLGDEISYKIRHEALRRGLNPPDRVREILGLPVSRKPVRPRLSISLSRRDFELLAERFNVSPEDRLAIRQLAADALITYIETDSQSDNEQ